MSTADNVIPKNRMLSWLFAIFAIFLFALVAVSSERPVGSLEGRVSIAEKFHLSTYDIKGNKVYVVAMGPREQNNVERGVWVRPDGTFRIDQLPQGEYQLKVRARGYSTNYIEGIFVREGKVAQVPSPIVMEVLEPSVSVASNTRVFTTKEKPYFWLNTNGALTAQVKVFKFDFMSFAQKLKKETTGIDIFTDLNLYKSEQQEFVYKDSTTPVVMMERKLTCDYEDSAHEEFKLNQTLLPGDYLVVAETQAATGKKSSNLFWFSVSDLGLIIKQAPEQTLVRAVDLNTLKPKAGVVLSLYNKTNNFGQVPIGNAKTGADGFVSISTAKYPKTKDSADYILCGADNADRAYGGLSYWYHESQSYKTYFYTERPVYRLGQTVYFKGLSRKLTPTGYEKPHASEPLTITISDPDNNKLSESKVLTTNHGTFHGTFDIPPGGKTGAYQVAIKYPDSTSDTEYFEVAEYRKPEYQVEVIPLAPRVVAGSKLKARVKATYYFGAPVANAKVHYSVYSSPDWAERYRLLPRPDYYSFFDSWADSIAYGGGGDYICDGYAQTDDSGEAIIEFDTKAPQFPTECPSSSEYKDMRYKIDAEVTDLSRIAVIGSGTCAVSLGNFAMFVEANNYVVKAGDPLSAKATVCDYDGKPIANQKVTFKLVRCLYDTAHNYDYKGNEEDGTYTAQTGTDGKVLVAFRAKNALPTDTYYITATANDNQGHLVFDQDSLWIANENIPYQSGAFGQPPLSVKLDKQVYKPGETAKVMITCPSSGQEGADALISVEGNRLYNYRVVPMKASAQMVEIPITSDYAPNVYISAVYVGNNHQFYSQSELLKVSPQEHMLNIAVHTDKPKYKPGEKVNYTIAATYANGKPAANAELSLGVVDESIYSIRPETATNIQKFFWSERENWVTTLSSFPQEYSGGPDKNEPRLRKNFKDTAAWMPELITNDKGIAQATVTLPDNLTTWRATVRGIDSEVNVGEASQKIISTQDLIVQLALPRFFTEGDQGSITAIVHNYTDGPQQINLVLEADPEFKLAVAPQKTLTVQADKAERYSFPAELVSPGNAKVTIKAYGQNAGDAMQVELPVRPLGIEAFDAQSGLIAEDNATKQIPLSLPQGAKNAQCNLYLASSSIGPVLGNFNSLIDYPYGCTEQTTSRLIPSIIAVQLHKQLGMPISQADTAKFKKVESDALSKLKDYRHEDGGWGWWKYDSSDLYLTSYVMEGLYLLKQAGYSYDTYITDDQINQSLKWMADSSATIIKQLSDPKHATIGLSDRDALLDVCTTQYVLSLYGKKTPPALSAALLNRTEQMYPEALSYLCLAFAQMQDKDKAQKPYQRLFSLANREDTYIDFDHSQHMVAKLDLPSEYRALGDYTYRFTGVESTALALRATLALEPSNQKQIESLKQWLILERGKDGWGNTKTTAQVLRTLALEEAVCGKGGETSFQLKAMLAGLSLADVQYNSQSLYAPETSYPISLSATPQTLELDKSGIGRLYWSTLASYFRNLTPGSQVTEKSMPDGLKITRSFYRLKAAATTSDGKVHFATEPINDLTVHAGETILMKLAIETPVSLPYVIVDEALPSGGEVVSGDPRENLIGSDDSGFSIDDNWGDWWWAHQDILDDRIVFFATQLKPGKSEFRTLVRMELPGEFQMNPLSLKGMYTRNVHAYSQIDKIKVVE